MSRRRIVIVLLALLELAALVVAAIAVFAPNAGDGGRATDERATPSAGATDASAALAAPGRAGSRRVVVRRGNPPGPATRSPKRDFLFAYRVDDGSFEETTCVGRIDSDAMSIYGLDTGATYLISLPADHASAWIRVTVGAGEFDRPLSSEPVAGTRIRVVLGDTAGTPVDEATVRVRTEEPDRFVGLSWTARRMTSGTFVAEDVLPGRVEIDVETAVSKGVGAGVLALGREIELEVTVPARAHVAGTVTDARGKPWGGARVEATVLDDPDPAWRGRGRTDPDGRFRLAVPSGVPVRVFAWARGGDSVSVEAVAPGPEVRLVVDRPSRVRVRLVDDHGNAVTDDVTTRVRSDLDVRPVMSYVEDGAVVVEGVGPNPETLELLAEGWALVRREVRVAPEAELDLGTIHLGRGLRVAGVVEDTTGRPVRGAAVAIGGFERRTSGADGRFEFLAVADGRIHLLVAAEGFLVRELDVEARDASDLRMPLARGARIAGTVVGADGRGLGSVVLSITRADGPDAGRVAERLRTDDDGTFEARVPPGRYRIEGVEGDDRPGVLLADLTVADGQDVTPTLVLRATSGR